MALSPKDKRLIRVAVAIVLGNWPLLRELRQAAPTGEPDRAWREMVLQTHLFAGFPRVVEASEVIAKAGGLGTPGPEELEEHGDLPGQGAALFGSIYAGQTERVRQTLKDYHPTLESWIIGHAYGRVLSRPGLGADRRELAAVACLVALGQERQLASHVRGAARVGATKEEVHETLELIQDLLPPDTHAHGKRVVRKFLGA